MTRYRLTRFTDRTPLVQTYYKDFASLLLVLRAECAAMHASLTANELLDLATNIDRVQLMTIDRETSCDVGNLWRIETCDCTGNQVRLQPYV